MSESFDLSYHASDDEDNITTMGERRNSIDLDLMARKQDFKSTDSLMMEVFTHIHLLNYFNAPYIFHRNLENMVT